MSDHAELVKRLRALVIMDEVGSNNPLGREAADAIEALIRERDAAEARGERKGLEKAAVLAQEFGGENVPEFDNALRYRQLNIARAIRALIPNGTANATTYEDELAERAARQLVDGRNIIPE